MSEALLSRDEFGDALRKGKGRAVQHVRAHGDAGVDDLLLAACLHCQSHDPQSEGYRSDWLMGMLAMLPDASRYYAAVLAAFPGATDGHDAEQMAGMLVMLAEHGHAGARDALYSKFDRQEFNEYWMLRLKLIALDGLEGLLHVARVLGHRLAIDADFELDGYLRYVVDEQFGSETVDRALLQAAVGAEEIRRFHEEFRRPEAERVPVEPYPLDAFVADLTVAKRNARILASRFARQGSQAEHLELFERLERETQPQLIAGMLRVFAVRIDPPHGIDGVLRFARHVDSAVREAAIGVLRRFADDRIAELSGELLAAGSLKGIELLAENWRPGDFDRVHQLLPPSADDRRAHVLALAIVSTGRPNPHSEAADCLVWVYEQNPCAFCRQGAIEDLIGLSRLPEAIATECLDDCMSEIREAVATSPSGERSGRRPG
ncbi:MAG TPA: hypothetical protein VGV07_08885 [Devosia sp.]|uniref:hypothetical protein n=1 Tax=Devosia sp. TaxID=1871048 RepID=UPI002DDD55EF|nr:hypothetical protein [Devosia sp.]HEV2515351.1 hypothetical protein [Devosia sp.]